MESLFNRLLKFIPAGDRIPREDFFTEIFAHLLRRHPDILHDWLQESEILYSDSAAYTRIDTQFSYDAFELHLQGSRPDIKIEVHDDSKHIIFIESKIDSLEGNEQLKRYAEHLDSELTDGGYGKLIYITRDYDEKDTNAINAIIKECKNKEKLVFKALRWHQVYHFLKKYRKHAFVDETMKFMEVNNMDTGNQFSPIDILALTNFPHVLRMIDEIMKGDVRERLVKLTGGDMQPASWSHQLISESRYCNFSFLQEDMACGYGFWFDSSNAGNYPKVGALLSIKPTSSKSEVFKNAISEILKKYPEWERYRLPSGDEWPGIWQLKNLRDFLAKEDHVVEIRNFLLSVMNDLEAIKEQYPDLPWGKN